MIISLMRLCLMITILLTQVACEESSFFPKDNFGSIQGDDDPGFAGDGPDFFIDDPDNLELRLDQYIQNADTQNKIDILWVIDNSGSMSNEQQNLSDNFEVFIDRFIDSDMDFRMAIITTDTRDLFGGIPVPGSMEKLTSDKLKEDEAQFRQDFRDLVKVGTTGWGIERGLLAAQQFFDRGYYQDLVRDDAFLAIIMVSDEEDQSTASVDDVWDYILGHKEKDEIPGFSILGVDGFINYYQSFKDVPAKLQIHSIVNIAADQVGNGIVPGADRYVEASIQTNGAIAEINDDFYETLDELSEKITELTKSFPLSHAPEIPTIKVYVDNIRSYDWDYNQGNNAVRFYDGKEPPEGSGIKISYELKY